MEIRRSVGDRQHDRVATWRDGTLHTPTERIYRAASTLAAARLRFDASG